MSGDKNSIDAYKQAEDIHRMTASQVFHTPYEEVTSQQRSTKAVTSVLFMESVHSVLASLSITRKEAEIYIKQYFEAYPKIKHSWMDLFRQARKREAFTHFSIENVQVLQWC